MLIYHEPLPLNVICMHATILFSSMIILSVKKNGTPPEGPRIA